MAVYTYSCCGCWDQFDARRSVAERDAPIDCPVCGTAAVREFSTQVNLRQPCVGWTELTRFNFLPERSERVMVTKGMGKVRV